MADSEEILSKTVRSQEALGLVTYGSAKTTSVFVAVIATYCFPFLP